MIIAPPKPVPANHIRFGMTDTVPLDLLLDQLREKHFAIAGPTGQRKTLFALSVLKQFVALPEDVCVYVDLGGDPVAYWVLADAAKKADKPVYFFSLNNLHDTVSWDPVLGTPAYAVDTTVASSGVATGLELLHGSGYGRSFYGRLNQREVDSAFDNLIAAKGRLPSFPELVRELSRMGEASRNAKHVSEAFLAAERLLRYDALTGKRPRKLDLGQAIDEGAVIYFYLPTALREEASRSVASMLMRAVMAQCEHRCEEGLPKRYVHLGVDEYPQVAASRGAVDSAMVLARKWSLTIWAIFQDDTQLVTPEGDLRSIIRSQCQRILFARESEEEIKELRERSRDVLRDDTSQSLRGLSHSTSVRQVLEPAISRNDVLELSGVAMRAYAVLRLGDKHRDPIPFTIIPPTASPAEHDLLKRKKLPRYTPASGAAPAEPTTDPLTLRQAERRKRLQDLHHQVRVELSWRLRSDSPSSSEGAV
ncbi:hypothetical protein [Botrimarina mediterranea]|uniref:AAA-like domain protein n=1 Tax=Botrimarina mediterranea TaxID=2528022 RepID=A0A518K9T1_9BACT|nr:hypothetical protein [Botrimarina mediterranea]QDV74552.1 AAA-like domain protein [Botrimarina mediterranea]QDV79192.1 AAA-like domain protein [Planctomycetes bacterium K2D]